MKRSLAVRQAVHLVIVSLLFPALLSGAGKFVPPEGKILLFVGQDNDSIHEYVTTTGMVPAGLMAYTSISDLNGLSEPSDYGAGVIHAQYLIREYPDTALQIGLYMVDMLDAVNNGVYDENIDALGRWIAATKRPVYLRIGYEFDGRHNHYDPAQYVLAFRRIVDRLRKNGVTNAAFVWHSCGDSLSRRLIDWYPGDGYVDWCGISYFDQPQSLMAALCSFAKEHGKPLMICESTPTRIGAKYGRLWFKGFFEFIRKNDVRCVSYINCDWDALPMYADAHWKDSRISSSAAVKKQWLDEIAGDRYLQSSKGLFGLIGYKAE